MTRLKRNQTQAAYHLALDNQGENEQRDGVMAYQVVDGFQARVAFGVGDDERSFVAE